jgi:hypothetical protein
VELSIPQQVEGEACGIPHLAKNERDVGHPAVAAGIEFKSPFTLHLLATARDDNKSLLQPALFQHWFHAGVGSQPRLVHSRQIFRIPA